MPDAAELIRRVRYRVRQVRYGTANVRLALGSLAGFAVLGWLGLHEKLPVFLRFVTLDDGVRQPATYVVSSAGESHPDALSEPYVNVSAHTAPAKEPRRTPICQCANSPGSRREMRAIQCIARRRWPRSFLYFR